MSLSLPDGFYHKELKTVAFDAIFNVLTTENDSIDIWT